MEPESSCSTGYLCIVGNKSRGRGCDELIATKRLPGLQKVINAVLYDMAMEKVNYWHLSPDEEVQDYQKDYFSIFCSDVKAGVPFHSQYLLSANYQELYSAGNPIWYTMITERAANVDLLTGKIYELDTDRLVPFRTESGFWEKYERSRQTGQILECQDLQTTL